MIINIKTKDKFKLYIPVSMFVFFEIFDCVRDLLAVMAIVLPRIDITINNHKYNARSLVNALDTLLLTLESVKFMESFDLVNVDTKDVKVIIKIV